MDEITLHFPREKPFYGIANLVLGGLAARLRATVEGLDDLQLAVESLLEAEVGEGDVTVALRVRQDTLETHVGPLGHRVRQELARAPGGDVGLRRILETVSDSVELGERDGAPWVALTKTLAQSAQAGAG